MDASDAVSPTPSAERSLSDATCHALLDKTLERMLGALFRKEPTAAMDMAELFLIQVSTFKMTEHNLHMSFK